MEVPCGTVVGNYDMIIGRDMLTDLGIDIRFSDNVISWDGAEMPLKEFSGGKIRCIPRGRTCCARHFRSSHR
jgi:hypothetical protein